MNARTLLLATALLALAACGRSATAPEKTSAAQPARLDPVPDTTGRGVNMGGGGN